MINESPNLSGRVIGDPGLEGRRGGAAVVDLLRPQLLRVFEDELGGRNLLVEPGPLAALKDVLLVHVLVVPLKSFELLRFVCELRITDEQTLCLLTFIVGDQRTSQCTNPNSNSKAKEHAHPWLRYFEMS